MKPFLSIIIPAYNEAHRLPTTLKELLCELRLVDFKYEIIVVNDGSSDETSDIVKTLQLSAENLNLISYKKNGGKGFAVKQGMLSANGEWRLFMDADNSTSFTEFKKMAPYIVQNYDVLVGSRYVYGATILSPQLLYRRFLGRAGNLIFQLLFFSGISDIHCGFKCFKENAAKKIFSQTKINRWAFDDEVLVLTKKFGYNLKEIPIVWRDEKVRATITIFDYIAAFFDILRIKYRLITKKYSL